MALAGTVPGFRALNSIIATWNSPDGPQADPADVVALQGFFLGYDRVCKNAGIQFDIRPAERILNCMEYDMPISLEEMKLLREEANKLLRATLKVRSAAIWFESLKDMEIYCHVHNWTWHGIGGREPAGSSAGSEKIAA
ncbi:hypothetical protein [Caballeronia pedi]|nr:hypothetical protein [Caballeronia pedi]